MHVIIEIRTLLINNYLGNLIITTFIFLKMDSFIFSIVYVLIQQRDVNIRIHKVRYYQMEVSYFEIYLIYQYPVYIKTEICMKRKRERYCHS
jgi:hypothetical protein